LWLEDYRKVTGRKALGSQAALGQFRARMEDGYTLDELRAASRGAHSDEFLRVNGYDRPETILAASKIGRYIGLGRGAEKADEGEARRRALERKRADHEPD
jgi:hypothetical protein